MNPADVAARLGAAEPEARRIATQGIADLRGKDAAALVVRALGDEDWRVRKEAALVAASVEPRAHVIDALVAALHDARNVGLRNAAVEALVGIGQDALGRVIAALKELDADGRKLAVEVLGGVPDPRGARALGELLADPDVNVRAAAAEALGRAGASGDDAREEAALALGRVLESGEMFVVVAALEALTTLEVRLPWSVLAPLAADPVLRRYALSAAARSRDTAAIGALAGAIGDPSATIAKVATTLLAERLMTDDEEAAGPARAALPRSKEVLARVRGWAREEEPPLRGAALVVLGLARNEEDVALLVDALADDSLAERAELALQLFGKEAAMPAIAAGKNAGPIARGASISMIPMLAAGGDVGPQLREALRSPQVDVQAGALKALAIAGGADDLAFVVPFARHSESRVASAALTTLFSIASREESSAAALRARLDPTGADAACGCVLIDARARAGRAIDDADLAFLRTSLAQGAVLARRAALEALASIGGSAAADAASFALADEEREVVARRGARDGAPRAAGAARAPRRERDRSRARRRGAPRARRRGSRALRGGRAAARQERAAGDRVRRGRGVGGRHADGAPRARTGSSPRSITPTSRS